MVVGVPESGALAVCCVCLGAGGDEKRSEQMCLSHFGGAQLESKLFASISGHASPVSLLLVHGLVTPHTGGLLVAFGFPDIII